MYATLTAPGTNQLIDPLNPARSLTTNFDGSTVPANLTDAVTYLEYRDDYQMVTTNIYYNTPGGLALVAGTYHPFGNNGTTAYLGSANSGANTSLNNRLVTNGPAFISAAQLLVDLTGASDHLPLVADYTIPVPAPVIRSISLAGSNLALNVANSITGGVFTVLMSTNLSIPPASWNRPGNQCFDQWKLRLNCHQRRKPDNAPPILHASGTMIWCHKLVNRAMVCRTIRKHGWYCCACVKFNCCLWQ